MDGEMQSFINRLSRLSAETLIRAALAALLGDFSWEKVPREDIRIPAGLF